MILHLGGRPVTLLGSSMGGSAAIELIARHLRLVGRLILNDIGPHPGAPAQAARRHAGRPLRLQEAGRPAAQAWAPRKERRPGERRHPLQPRFHQTRWSEDEGGRICRHDVRAMQAYRRDAQTSLRQWAQWGIVRVPMLLIHGLQSDALLLPTVRRMSRRKDITIMHPRHRAHAAAGRPQPDLVRARLAAGPPLAAGSSGPVLHASPTAATRARRCTSPLRPRCASAKTPADPAR